MRKLLRSKHRSAASENAAIERGDSAVLFLLHASPFADPRVENVGGTQFHVADLVRALALPRSVIAHPAGDALHVAEVCDGRLEAAVHHELARRGRRDRFVLRDDEAEAQVGDLIDRFDVAAVHLHHLQLWPVGVWRTLRARGLPYLYTAHDFYCVCPSLHVFDLERWRICRCVDETPEHRASCMRAMYALCEVEPPADPTELDARLHAHRDEFGALLEAAHAVLAPSRFAARRVSEAYPGRKLPLSVVPPFDPPRGAISPGTAADEPLRVGVLGAIAAPWKGAAALIEVIRQVVASGAAVEWHLFGLTDAFTFPWDLEYAAAGRMDEVVRVHGRYRRDDVAGMLAQQRIDVTLHLSAVEETYCYTLSESWAAGIPALVTPVGALAERVADTDAGRVVATPDDTVRALLGFAAERGDLASLRERARSAPLAAGDEIVTRYRDLYRALLTRDRARLTRAASKP